MAGEKVVKKALDFLRSHPNFKPYQSTWRGDRPSIYDPKFFDLKPDHLTDEAGNILATKQIPVSKEGVSFDLPATKDPEKIYRGMSAEEFANFQKNQYIQSHGQYNIGDEQKGLTYFSEDPEMARSYAHSFAPSDFYPDPARPGYVVAVKRPPAESIAPPVAGTSEAEIGVLGQIPRGNVTNVYRGNVVDYTEALKEPSIQMNPRASVLWEEINDYSQGGVVERALRLARGGYADGGDAEVQSNSMPVISDGQINWGDSNSAADFARADQALQAMRSAPAPEPQAAPRIEPRRAPPVYSAPRDVPRNVPSDVPLPPVRPAYLDRPYEPEGPFGALDMSSMQPQDQAYGHESPYGALDLSAIQPTPQDQAYGHESPYGALDLSAVPVTPPAPIAPPAPTTDELLALLSNPTQSAASAAIDQAAPIAKFTDRAAPGISMTPQQRDLIIRTIAAESSGKTLEEGQGIAHVIMNRIMSGRYGKTPERVLFAPKQFEPWTDPRGSNYPMRHKPGSTKYEKAQAALDAAMGGDDITGGATLFWGPKAQAALGRPAPKWGRTGGLDIGDTRFHRDDGGMVEEREGHAGGEAVGKLAKYLRSKTPEMTARDIAGLLRAGRSLEVTDSMLGQADPRLLHELYASGKTGVEMPMDYAARMKRASELGYDQPMYRGTQAREALNRSLQTERSGEGKTSGTGAWLSSNPDIAATYSGYEEFGPVTLPLLARSADLRQVPWGGNLWSQGPEGMTTDQVARLAREQGARGIAFPEVTDVGPHLWSRADLQKRIPETATSFSIFDPSIVRSPFARFDPRLDDLTDLNRASGGFVHREHHADGDPVGDDQEYPDGARPLTIYRGERPDAAVGPVDTRGPTSHARYQATLGQLGRSGDVPPMDPAVMGENWANAVKNYRDFPRAEGEPTMSARTPSTREQIGDFIAGDDQFNMASTIRQRLAQLAVGEGGQGGMGVGALDFVPFAGSALNATDISHQLGEGDYLGAGISAGMTALPFAGRLVKPAVDYGRRAVEVAKQYAPQAGAAVGAGAVLTPQDAEAANVRKALQMIATIGHNQGPSMRTLQSDLSKTKHTIPVEEMNATRIPAYNMDPRPTLDPASLQGSTLINAVGDRTMAGHTLVDINGQPLAYPVKLEGGPDFMRGSAYQNQGAVWASDETPIKSISNFAKKLGEDGKDLNLVYSAMGARSGDFSHMMADAILAQMQGRAIPKEVLDELNTRMLQQNRKWPGIASTDEKDIQQARDVILKNGNLRKQFTEEVALANLQNKGFPDIASTRYAITDPSMIGKPTGFSGYSVARLDPNAGYTNAPNAPHTTYPSQLLGGDYRGGLERQVPRDIMFPNFYKERRAAGIPTEGDDRSFTLKRVSQDANQEWLDNLMKWIERDRRSLD